MADFNGDGIPDVATAIQSFSTSISLLLSNGDGTFVSSPSVATQCAPDTLAEADFNGDGIADLLLTDCYDNLHMLLGNGNATFTPWTLPWKPVYSVSAVAGDLNGDGIPDLVLTDYTFSQVDILLGKGDGGFVAGPIVNVSAGGFPEGAAIGDFNGDGIPDVLTANGFVDTMSEWFGTITASQTTATRVLCQASIECLDKPKR